MSSLFRRGKWGFRRQEEEEEEEDVIPRLMEDESFDVASNAPVYLSRKELGEWMVPLDEENGQPVEIMEDDDEDSDNNNDDDDKFSADVSPSVASTSTVAESREFWLNCLKENGVDMTTQMPHGSPRKSLSFIAKGLEASPRTDPLKPHNHNAMQQHDDDHQPTSDIVKQQPAVLRNNVEASVDNNESNASVSSDDESIKHVDSHPSVDSSVAEQTAEPTDQTMDKTEISMDWNKWSFTDGIPLEDMLQERVLLEPEHEEETDVLQTDKFFADSLNYFRAAATDGDTVPDESLESKKNDSVVGDSDTAKDETAVGASFEITWPDDLPKENVAKKPSPAKVVTVTSEETEPTQLSEEESLSYIPKRSTVQVVTVSSNDTFDTSIAESDVPDQTGPGELQPPSHGLEDLISASIDHSLFVDESQDTASTKGRWPPKRETQEEQEHSTHIAEPKNPPPNPLPGTSIESEKTLPQVASQVLKQKPATTMVEGAKPITVSNSHLPKQAPTVDPAATTVEAAKPKTGAKDPNGWMYLVWYRKGLMNQIPSNCIGPGDATLRIRTSFPTRKRSNAVSTSITPTATSRFADAQTEKTKNGNQNDSEPLVTPREAMRTLDYKALQADEENSATRPRRTSLPVNIRASAKKEGGRKSFESIMKMWRNKSNDHSNGMFSPEQYMAQESRERAQNPPKTRPTQHSQLLCIAGKTAAFRREGNQSTPRQRQSGEKVSPRSASVGSAKKLAASVDSSDIKKPPTQAGSTSSATKKSPHLSYSPLRDFSIDEQLQRPPKRPSSGKRRKSQPLPAKKSAEKVAPPPSRRETINPKEHFRPGRSRTDYKSVLKNDYKSVVRSFLASVEEHKELEEPREEAKADEITSNLSGIDPIPQESIVDASDDFGEAELITPRNADQSTTAPLSAQQSASKDSPWTQQVVRQLEELPAGSGGKKSSWRDDRPWREDLVKRRVSDFSDNCSVASGTDEGPCQCSSSVFSGNDALIDFFLPQMGMACNCGKRALGLRNPEEPTSLDNILRPWQVSFLAAFGIHRGDQLVKAHHRSAKALANALRQYRRKHGMTPFRTKSCGMALQIWSKTCKAYVRSIRKQLTTGTTDLKVPNTLYIISSFLEKMHEMHSPMPRDPHTVLEDEASV